MHGATLCATRLSGKLNGVIALTTPSGNRRANPKCPPPGATRPYRAVRPAVVAPLRGHGESDDRSRDFPIRKRAGLPGLGDHRLDKIRTPLLDAVRDSCEQVASRMGRLCPRDFKRLVRHLDRLIHRLCVSQWNLRKFLSGVGVNHRRGAACLAPLGADEQPRSFCAGHHLPHLLDFAFFDKDF